MDGLWQERELSLGLTLVLRQHAVIGIEAPDPGDGWRFEHGVDFAFEADFSMRCSRPLEMPARSASFWTVSLPSVCASRISAPSREAASRL